MVEFGSVAQVGVFGRVGSSSLIKRKGRFRSKRTVHHMGPRGFHIPAVQEPVQLETVIKLRDGHSIALQAPIERLLEGHIGKPSFWPSVWNRSKSLIVSPERLNHPVCNTEVRSARRICIYRGFPERSWRAAADRHSGPSAS